jgi:hypothetical protein
LISIESLISIAFSVGLTVYAYNIAKDGDPSTSFDGSAMDWVLLSFAVVTPISASIGMAFTRRERALREIAEFKATTKNLYMAHASWDWCKAGPKAATTGRAASTDVDWLQHNDRVMAVIFRICSDLTRLLTLPTSNRGRHRVSLCGQQQRLQIEQLSRKLQRNIHYDICILSSECEILKREGLPPNEATRVRQWERFISERIEALLMIKRYRTPQALRSFARCFTIFLPPFYAPFYATMAVDLNSLGMAVAFSILTSLALTSLFEAVAQLEDPFVGLRLDGINVERDLRDELLVELIDSRAYYFPNASKFELDIKVRVSCFAFTSNLVLNLINTHPSSIFLNTHRSQTSITAQRFGCSKPLDKPRQDRRRNKYLRYAMSFLQRYLRLRLNKLEAITS